MEEALKVDCIGQSSRTPQRRYFVFGVQPAFYSIPFRDAFPLPNHQRTRLQQSPSFAPEAVVFGIGRRQAFATDSLGITKAMVYSGF